MSKVWLVTGAARGLGRSIAEAVLEAGDRLIAGTRDTSMLAGLVERYPHHIVPIALDVRDEAAAAKAVLIAHEKFGALDVLVNNAGYGHLAPFEEMTPTDFRDQVETNFFGVVHLTRAAIPLMRVQRRGHIFQISSVGGRISTPGLSAYQAAKWAVGGFSDVLAKEVGHLGIRVCTLEPGGMRTGWADEAKKDAGTMSADYEPSVGKVLELLRAYGGREIGDPAKIAASIVQLSRLDELPSRLLLGGDALHVCNEAEAQRAEELARWRSTSLSTHFPDADLPPGLD